MSLSQAVEFLKANRIIKRDVEIAERTGYSKGVVSNYLNGKIEVSEKFKKKFFEVYKEELKQNNVSETKTEYQNFETIKSVYENEIALLKQIIKRQDEIILMLRNQHATIKKAQKSTKTPNSENPLLSN